MQQAPAHTSGSHNVSCMPKTLADRQTDRQTQADRQMQADRPAANRHRQADRQHRLVQPRQTKRQAGTQIDRQTDGQGQNGASWRVSKLGRQAGSEQGKHAEVC